MTAFSYWSNIEFLENVRREPAESGRRMLCLEEVREAERRLLPAEEGRFCAKDIGTYQKWREKLYGVEREKMTRKSQ